MTKDWRLWKNWRLWKSSNRRSVLSSTDSRDDFQELKKKEIEDPSIESTVMNFT
jgi:hypothetical protein